MEFPSGDLKPFRIPKKTDSPKTTQEAHKKEMPPLPTVSKRHQIATIEFETPEKPTNAGEPSSRHKRNEERHNRERKRQPTSAAPLDNIMSEMTRETKRPKKEPILETKPHPPAPVEEKEPVLTKEYLENRKVGDDLAYNFLSRKSLMEILLGRKMIYGRLESYQNLNFERMTDAEIAQINPAELYYPCPSGDMPEMPQTMTRRPKGPKTPPGSPGGPRTPPDPPPPLPSEQQKIFSHLSAASGMHPQQLEAYFGAEVSRAISNMDQTTLLESIKTAIVSAGQSKSPSKPPPPPVHKTDNESVKMELVSDCSLSLMNDDDEEDVLAPPPPPPVIDPPPPPPCLPPLPIALPPPPSLPPPTSLPPPPSWPPTSPVMAAPPLSSVPPLGMPPLHIPPPFTRPSVAPQPLLNMQFHTPPPARFPAMNIPPPMVMTQPNDVPVSLASGNHMAEKYVVPPPPAAAPPPPAPWMASSNLPSWTDENLGDWSKEDSWIPAATRPKTPVVPPPPPPQIQTPSTEKITNTLLSALGLGAGCSQSGPPPPVKAPPHPPPAPPPEVPLLDRYGRPLPVPMGGHRPMGIPPVPPARGRGRGGPSMGFGAYNTPMTPPTMLRYPNMGNSPMAGHQPRRRGGTGGRAMKLPP